jgi:hypothetical protein
MRIWVAALVARFALPASLSLKVELQTCELDSYRIHQRAVLLSPIEGWQEARSKWLKFSIAAFHQRNENRSGASLAIDIFLLISFVRTRVRFSEILGAICFH